MLIRPVYRPRLPSLALGLVGWYPLDNDILDYSGRNNNGTLVNAPIPSSGRAPSINGRTPGSYSFNGTNQNITSSPITGTLSALTISYWGYRSSSSNVIVAGWGDTAQKRIIILVYSDGNVYYVVDTGSADTYANVAFTGTGWHMYTLVYGSTNILCYLDGVKQTKVDNGPYASSITISGNFDIGRGPLNSYQTTGNIDDVRIWNRALSSGEILALYAEAFQPLIDIETIALMQVAAAGGFTPKFRKTLSQIGGRIGTRQVAAGWGA